MIAAPVRKGWREIRGECPCCHHRGWCTTSEDGAVIKCMRATSDRPVKQKDGSVAYLHSASSVGGPATPAKEKKQRPRLTRAELTAELKLQRTAVNPKRLDMLSEKLGVSVKSMKAFGVGYDSERGAWSFPMVDADRKPVGIHYRYLDGTKSCKVGSRLGLFVPEDYDPKTDVTGFMEDPDPMVCVLPEGVSDACAAYDLGLVAIGRPSNRACPTLMAALLASLPKQEVVVFADNDGVKYLPDGTPFWPGIEGGVDLARAILQSSGKVKFLVSPDGSKDLRDWLAKGGDRPKLLASILCAPVVDKRWLERADARLAERKRLERKKCA